MSKQVIIIIMIIPPKMVVKKSEGKGSGNKKGIMWGIILVGIMKREVDSGVVLLISKLLLLNLIMDISLSSLR